MIYVCLKFSNQLRTQKGGSYCFRSSKPYMDRSNYVKDRRNMDIHTFYIMFVFNRNDERKPSQYSTLELKFGDGTRMNKQHFIGAQFAGEGNPVGRKRLFV